MSIWRSLRITYLDNVILRESIKQYFDDHPAIHTYVMCEEVSHVGKKRHCHIIFEYTGKTIKNFKQNFKNKYKSLRGNKVIAFTNPESRNGTIEKGENYTCKGEGRGEYKLVGLKRYTVEDIKLFNNRYHDIADDIKAKKKEYKSKSLLKRCMEYIDSKTDGPIDVVYITYHVMNYYIEHDKVLPHNNRLRDIAETIELRMIQDPEKLREKMMRKAKQIHGYYDNY